MSKGNFFERAKERFLTFLRRYLIITPLYPIRRFSKWVYLKIGEVNEGLELSRRGAPAKE